MMMTLKQAAEALNTTCPTGTSTSFNAVSTDSRTVTSGDLYIAIKGDNFDGHDFVQQAAEKGAVAAVVSHQVDAEIPLLVVDDTRLALGQLATTHRQAMPAKVVAVTGSCGKTTTKTLLASVFSQAGNTLSNQKSFNNEVGVPLTLLSIRPEHEYAIVEMGASGAGDIAYLTHMGQPSVAMITCAKPVHLDGFGDLDGVACGKGEIFQGLPSDGVAIINQDDHYADFWKKLAGHHRVVTFSMQGKRADIMASNIKLDDVGRASFTLTTPAGKADIYLQLLGEHNVVNALATAAAAYASELTIANIQAGLQQAAAHDRRLSEKAGIKGVVVIDDSYNANPQSVEAAIAVLASRQGESVLVLGDMLELGPEASKYHQLIGEKAQEYGIGRIYCYGDLTRHTAEAFGENGYYFTDQDELIHSLKDYVSQGMVVLVKGSNAMKMDRITAALMEN